MIAVFVAFGVSTGRAGEEICFGVNQSSAWTAWICFLGGESLQLTLPTLLLFSCIGSQEETLSDETDASTGFDGGAGDSNPNPALRGGVTTTDAGIFS